MLLPPPTYFLENRTDTHNCGVEYRMALISESIGLGNIFFVDSMGFMKSSSSTDLLSSPAIFELTTTDSKMKQKSLQKEFCGLVEKWKKETFSISSLTKIYAHPSYQRIIAMGTEGLPLVLNELKDNGGRWFYALKFMSGKAGEDVALGATDYDDARAAWLGWGYRHNYI